MSNNLERVAARESWTIQPLPTTRANLDFAGSYSKEEFEKMKRGLVPHEMEDKWFIYFEDPWLYFHRSWSGNCIYGLRFDASSRAVSVVESWVNREPDLYQKASIDYNCALLKFLIEALLLRHYATFPVPEDMKDSPKGLYQHHVVGRAYPESLHSSQPGTHPDTPRDK